MRAAHTGWKHHKNSLEPHQKAALRAHGAEAGFDLEWTGEQWMEPKKIEPSVPPRGIEIAEKDATNDMMEVSGINESALGELDIGQSGRAIEARQRQAVIAVQMYFSNYSRTKELQGRKLLECVQDHYTEQRLFRILGIDGKVSDPMMINQHVINQVTGVMEIVNNVTSGRYRVVVDEVPLAATFASAQFEEMLNLLQKLGPIGQAVAGSRPDLIIDLSSLPRKEEWKAAVMQAVATTQAQQQAEQAAEMAGGKNPGAPKPPGGPGAAPVSPVGAAPPSPPAAVPMPMGAMV
jgi:hypothetical protein